MKEKENRAKIVFSDYYLPLELEEKKRIRTLFMQKTGLSYPTWYTKINRNKFSKLEILVLNKICNKSFIL